MLTSVISWVKGWVRALFTGGFFHIVGAGTLNRAISTVMSIVLVRVLSKADYGIYSYAINIINIFVLFNGLGASSAALQLCSEVFDDEVRFKSFYGYAYKNAMIISLGYSVIIGAIGLFAPLSIPEAAPLLVLYSIYPLLQQLYDIKLMMLRIEIKNQEYALATNIQTILMCVFSICGALLAQAAGLVIGQMLAYLIVYLWLCRKNPFLFCSSGGELTSEDVKQYWNVSLISSFNSGVSQALTLVGTFLIGLLLADELAVSTYNVATTIPFALLFVSTSIIIYIYPLFARNKNNRAWTLKHYALFTVGNVVLMAVISISFVVFAEPAIVLIFGDQYLDSVPVAQVLMIGFFANSAFRAPAANLLVTQRKLVTVSVIGIILILVSFASSYTLIPRFGLMGAALSYDVCMIVAAVLNSGAYLWSILHIPASRSGCGSLSCDG